MTDFHRIRCDHDGVALEALCAGPQNEGPHPAVLVMHSALGIGTKVREVVSELAGLGYYAIGTDMYGPEVQNSGADGDEQYEIYKAAYLDILSEPQKVRARSLAWFESARALPNVDGARIAAIGYCFGGKCVLELARAGADVKAVVSYHGTLTTHAPATSGAVKGEVAVYCGAKDPYAPQSDVDRLREELAAAEAPHQIMVFSEAEHSFTDPEPAVQSGLPGISYHAIADAVSWAGTLALLNATLRSP